MSRICDFCDRSEHEVPKMAEVRDDERPRKGFGAVHICIECAKEAIDAMTVKPKPPANIEEK